MFDLGGGILFAVKQINMSESTQAKSLFHAEVASLGQIRHRNVVKLQGWCQEKGKLLLVYDYMSNGTLYDWLYKNNSQQVLSLKMRLSILEGVGAALKYLHEDGLSCILHRDIKSSNVLLDADFNAYVGDFGLARLMGHHQLEKTTLAAGTFGYIAPELPYTGKATKESDVYSFGILVLEVVCRRHPLNLQTTEPEDLVLLFIVWRAYEGGSLISMVDPKILETLQFPREAENLNCNTSPKSVVANVDLEIKIAKIVNLLQLGLFCCLPNPKTRPSMGEVNRLLQEIQDIGNKSSITTVLMPSLPSTKPPGLYHLLEFSHNSMAGTSIAHSPTSLV